MSSNLIKGYLPVRLTFPSSKIGPSFTFLFVKQHMTTNQQQQTEGDNNGNNRTLFICNAPFYYGIRTKNLLQNLFERVGDVEKITVASPRQGLASQYNGTNNEETHECSDDNTHISMFNHTLRDSTGTSSNTMFGYKDEEEWYMEGKFAYVVFSTSKEMKKALSRLQKKGEEGVTFGRLELQELQDASQNLYNEQRSSRMDGEQEDILEDDDEPSKAENLTGIMAVANAQRSAIIPRELLKQVCNEIMDKYETIEEDMKEKQKGANSNLDEDGFLTVYHSAAVGDKAGMEVSKPGVNHEGGRRKAMKRSRNISKKKMKGSDELKDFYRFQMKEGRKRNVEALREKFQEDLRKVKKMKEDRQYRPF